MADQTGQGSGDGLAQPAPPAKARKPFWKRWWFIAIVAIVLLSIVGAALGGGGDDGDAESEPEPTELAEAGDTANDTTPEQPDSTLSEEPPSTTEAQVPSTTPPPNDPVVGDSVDLDGGAVARVNTLQPQAPPLNEIITPSPGTSFTRFDVEMCAGDTSLSMNPLYWSAQLDDNTMAEAALGAQGFETIDMAPGGCQRGTVDVEVPDGKTVSSVVLTDTGLQEVARWQAGAGAPPTAALSSGVTPSSLPFGESAPLEADANAVVFSVTANAPPLNEFSTPPPGSTFSRLDVELCAGSEPLSVNPLYWYGVLNDNQLASAELGAQGLQTIDLAPGQCQRGTVDVAVPDGLTVSAVVLTDTGLAEVARWAG